MTALTTAGDATVMVGRSLRRTSRMLDSVLISLILPVALMLLFVYVFGGAIETGGAYINYVVPGIVILCAGFGSAQTSVSVAEDMTNRVVDRFRTMPVTAWTVLVGHAVASVARNVVATTLVLAVAYATGFRPDATPVEWLAAAALVLLVVAAITWVSVCFGLLARSAEAADGFGFAVLFLPYVSSAFVPTSTMPAWLRVVADHQPVTPVIETLRGLLTGTEIGGSGPAAVAWYGGILVVAVVLAARLFTRRTAG